MLKTAISVDTVLTGQDSIYGSIVTGVDSIHFKLPSPSQPFIKQILHKRCQASAIVRIPSFANRISLRRIRMNYTRNFS